MEEKQVRYQLGALSSVEPVTFGEPGRRTFKLDIQSGSAVCSLWLEKEQLFQLGVYLRDYVGSLSADEKGRASEPREPSWQGGEESIDFKAGQMFLSHDKESNSFYLQAHERETEEDRLETETESVSFWITMKQAHRVGRGVPADLRRGETNMLSVRPAHQPRRPHLPQSQRAHRPRGRLTVIPRRRISPLDL